MTGMRSGRVRTEVAIAIAARFVSLGAIGHTELSCRRGRRIRRAKLECSVERERLQFSTRLVARCALCQPDVTTVDRSSASPCGTGGEVGPPTTGATVCV